MKVIVLLAANGEGHDTVAALCLDHQNLKAVIVLLIYAPVTMKWIERITDCMDHPITWFTSENVCERKENKSV